MLFKRDFKILTPEEEIEYRIFKKIMSEHGWETAQDSGLTHRSGRLEKYPAIIYRSSLFPNNRIVPGLFDGELDGTNHSHFLNEYKKLIQNKNTRERDILNFIKETKSYFLITSILVDYANWGHHEVYLFKGFELGVDYVADYLIVGKNSEGYHLFFVELESVYGRITINDGSVGESIRKGLNQVSDWRTWLEANFSHLKQVFKKHINDDYELPSELYEFDSTRISFAIICGRRNDFNTKTYQERRRSLTQRIAILHYDNIYDMSESLVRYNTHARSAFLTRKGVSGSFTNGE